MLLIGSLIFKVKSGGVIGNINKIRNFPCHSINAMISMPLLSNPSRLIECITTFKSKLRIGEHLGKELFNHHNI